MTSFYIELLCHVDDQYHVDVKEVEGTVPEFAKYPTLEGPGRLADSGPEVSFPACRKPGDERTPVTLRSEILASRGSMAAIRVLICDDESRLVNLTAGLLRECGYDVLAVKSGEEAITLVSQQSVDVVILDVNLPGEDSLEVARRLLQIRSVAIVLSSGFAEEDVDIDLLKLPGVRAFLAKPYGIEVLATTIRRVVDDST